MHITRTGPHWISVWFWWLVATTAGWALGFAAGETLLNITGITTNAGLPSSLVAAVLFGGVLGLILGLTQWLVLPDWVQGAGWWIPPSMIGSVIGWFVYSALSFPDLGPAGMYVPSVLGGLIAGLLQYFPLRRWVRNAWWWIPATGLAWAALPQTFNQVAFADWMYSLRTWLAYDAGSLRLASSGILSGAIIGLITGLTLVILARREERHFVGAFHRRMAQSNVDPYSATFSDDE